ncbi:MAG: hypothetical protein IJK44_10025 [Bacteroidales bacterium]|nr:hypothetical protein [Bacteroidales bacterium]
MKKSFAILAILMAACFQGRAQFASLGSEKATTNWETLTSSNYKVIYPVGLDSLGRVYSAYLEQFRPLVGNSAGMLPNQYYRSPMPVILHPFAATSNGAVVWAPRRMDLYTFPDAYASLPPVPWEKILAIHENRHVAQNQFTRTGLKKYLYWPFGEIGLTLSGTLYENVALLEGDAVVAETALTNSGRGRTADFLSYIRMSFATGDMRDWYRWRYGSQRWYTPDYYRIGYMTVAGMRYNYDATMFMSDYLWNLTSPFAFNGLQKTMKKYSGKKIKGSWAEIAASFKDVWARDDSLRAPFQEPVHLAPAGRFFTSFRGAVQTKDGRVFALRSAMDRQQEMVQILPDGSVKVIRPMSADSRLAYSPYTDCIYWTESVPDLRWEMIQTSRIRFVEAGGKKVRDLASGRYVNPAVSPDGKALAAAEYPVTGGGRIVLLDISDGKEIRSITAPDGLQVTEVAFLGSGVAFTGISDQGMGLYLTDFSGISTLEAAVPVKIKNLVSHEGAIYFTCDRTGTNEIYSYTPGNLTQLTNTRHGVSSPFFMDGVLCFSALEPAGSILATVESPLSRRVSLADYSAYPIADVLSAQEKEFAERPAATDAPVQSAYSKPANFFHIHSWLPLYVNLQNGNSVDLYTYETATLGARAFFQNLTGTVAGSMGVSVHPDPFDEEKVAAGFHTTLTYSGLYPVIDFSLDVGDRQSAAISRAWIPSKDSTFISVKPRGSLFVGSSIGVSVPLNLSSGGMESTIKPSLTLKYSNDYIGEGMAFFKEDGVTEEGSNTATGKKGRDFFRNQSLVASVSADTRRQTAPSQIVPRLGVGGELRIVLSPFDDGIGSGIYAKAYTYLPGLMSTHGIKLSAAAQAKGQAWHYTFPVNDDLIKVGYYIPEDTWSRGFEDLSPRGFEKSGAGASMLLSPVSARFSMDYVFPMLYVDRAFSPYIYFSNMEVNPFADFSLLPADDMQYLYSAGADLVFRFEKLFMFSTTMKLGVRVAYNGGSEDLYKSTGLKSPVYVGFVANTEL